jgi:hypothetical protein
MQKSIYGEPRTCPITPSTETVIAPYLERLYNIMAQIVTKQNKEVALERLGLLEEELLSKLEPTTR